jgi:cyclic dehypoxanthinyl futalosine synthase
MTRIDDLLAKAARGGRLDPAEGLRLFEEADLADLGAAAHAVRLRLNPEPAVSYIIDRNVNYSNICDSYCRFCSFFAAPGAEGGYLLSKATLARKIEETKALGGNQILMQGGTHPEWDIVWYEDLIRFVKSHGIHVHALSSPEIQAIAKVSKLPVREVISRLRAAGLDSIPGGGAEILSDSARKAISPLKCTTEEWLEVHREAHTLGMRTTATMMFGHMETFADRVEHFDRIRALQDESLARSGATGGDAGFTAFICWAFQPTHAMKRMEAAGGAEYLRTLAIGRLYVQNVRHFQSSWVTMGPKVGQMALWFGCDDMGSTMIEENVVSSAGVAYRMTSVELCDVIRAAGFRPQQRDFFYRPVEARYLDAPERTRRVVGANPRNEALPDEAFEAVAEATAARTGATAR